MTLNPVLHRILVKPEKVETKTESGIYLALDERKYNKAGVIGTVVKVGSTAFKPFDTTAEEQGVVPGAKVYFAKYAGASTEDDEYVWLNDEDILGVVNE